MCLCLFMCVCLHIFTRSGFGLVYTIFQIIQDTSKYLTVNEVFCVLFLAQVELNEGVRPQNFKNSKVRSTLRKI